MDFQGFNKPDTILRPCPFWAINERLSPDEVARQMEDMIRVGMSGGFFHCRHGLVTEYLGEEWFEAMNAALKAATKNGGYLWLYDEDMAPSGNAGGRIAAMKEEYRAATLSGILVAPGEPVLVLSDDQALRRCYAIRQRDGLRITDIADVPLDRIDSAMSYERLFLVRTYDAKSGWWSGESHANLLHPQAMEQFVKTTYEVYLEKLGHEFGKRIPGIFTDEPTLNSSDSGIAWYEGIPDIYRRWTARDFWADMPYMFFEGPQARKVRLLVHRTLLRQFVEAYSKPIFEFCDKHGLDYTGHHIGEDDFKAQMEFHCGGVMAHYPYHHSPGIDHLCRQLDGYLPAFQGMLLTVKQASSAARQLGRLRVLDEIFGVSRHTNTFEDFKWLGDFDLVHGANFFVPHLALYSAKGRRKRDYPPNLNYQQTYWDDLKPLNDYFTRVAHALTRGKAAVDIVMLHSIESAAASCGLTTEVRGDVENGAHRVPVDVPKRDLSVTNELDDRMRKALESIVTAGHDCDLGDEGYIEEMGSVRGGCFMIGEMSYKLVVIPPSTTWRPRTLEMLREFVANGGKVVILGELPSELDCDDARQEWATFAKHPNVWSIACGITEIQDIMDELAPKAFTIKGTDGRAVPHTYVQRRIDDDQEIYFIVNSSRDAVRDYVLTFIGGWGKALLTWDAVAGTCEQIQGRDMDGDLRQECSLPPCGSLLLTLGGSVDGCSTKRGRLVNRAAEREVTALPAEFDFERVDPNVLVLDRMSVSYDGGATYESEDVEHKVRRNILTHFGTEAMLEWQPWVAIKKGLFDGKGGEIVLRYPFFSDLDKPRSFAVIEDMGKGQLFVNGTPVDVSNAGWHWDRGFGKVEVTDLVRKGENILDFRVHYDFLTEIEAAYIVGDFGVDVTDDYRGKIIEEPMKLKAGSWTRQGYPFYPGRMIYKSSVEVAEGKWVILKLVRPSGILFKVRVNKQQAGDILWRPYELDITSLLRPGVNHLEIEVVPSVQNAWGPLHEQVGDDLMWCGPNSFEVVSWWEGNILRDELNAFPYGLLGGAELVIL